VTLAFVLESYFLVILDRSISIALLWKTSTRHAANTARASLYLLYLGAGRSSTHAINAVGAKSMAAQGSVLP